MTNVLVGATDARPEAVIEDLVLLDDLSLRTLEADRPQLLLAMDAMARHDLSTYYALYAALALSTDATLATLDHDLAAAASAEGLAIEPAHGKRVSEERPRYVAGRPADPAWLRSAAVGRHIADLRRAALEQVG